MSTVNETMAELQREMESALADLRGDEADASVANQKAITAASDALDALNAASAARAGVEAAIASLQPLFPPAPPVLTPST